ncbi:hypothetical protein M405DRAFT_842094 [Rhizopogon salebrosus TDB-379]|nr:hypothetical protein M405DRAFT_842094 [Rhizopogon salebrosus TDB-379]
MTSSAKGSLLTYLASAKKSAMAKASESRCPPKSHVKPTPETMEKMDPGVAAVTIKAEKKRTVRSSKVPSTGDRPVDLYRQLAAALFLDREDSQWKDADINDLTDTVKNRVTNLIFRNGLPKPFVKYRDSMPQTGQGLIDQDREHETTVDIKTLPELPARECDNHLALPLPRPNLLLCATP